MRTSISIIAIVIGLGLASFTKPKTLTITSTAFANNGTIPVKYTCMGGEFSPPLHIAGVPPGTRSLAIVVFDPDVEKRVPLPPQPAKRTAGKKGKKAKPVPMESRGHTVICGFTHWILWNIDPGTVDLPENFRSDHVGMNSAGERNYKGMCPPSGTHRYHFMVYALDTEVNIDVKSDKAALEKVIEGHILGKGELIGSYNKTYK